MGRNPPEPQYIEYKHRNEVRRRINPAWVEAQAARRKKEEAQAKKRRSRIATHLSAPERNGRTLCGRYYTQRDLKVVPRLAEATCLTCRKEVEDGHMWSYYE